MQPVQREGWNGDQSERYPGQTKVPKNGAMGGGDVGGGRARKTLSTRAAPHSCRGMSPGQGHPTTIFGFFFVIGLRGYCWVVSGGQGGGGKRGGGGGADTPGKQSFVPGGPSPPEPAPSLTARSYHSPARNASQASQGPAPTCLADPSEPCACPTPGHPLHGVLPTADIAGPRVPLRRTQPAPHRLPRTAA